MHDLEKLKLNYRLLDETKQVEQLTTSAEEIKSFLDKKLKDLLNLRQLWGKFEVCFHHVEEIFAESDEVVLIFLSILFDILSFILSYVLTQQCLSWIVYIYKHVIG